LAYVPFDDNFKRRQETGDRRQNSGVAEIKGQAVADCGRLVV
jgi:hypothetical protein